MTFFGGRKLPPTPFGYQPPPDARVRSWNCTNRSCDHGEHAPDPRRWPKRCPQCHAPIGTGIIEPPYDHAAERFELDVKMSHPKAEWERALAIEADQIWRFKDALQGGDLARAAAVRVEADRAIASDPQPSSSGAYGQRMRLVWTALDFDDLEDAAAELMLWFSTADLSAAMQDSGVRANGRCLMDMAVRFLRHRGARGHPASPTIFASLTAVVAGANEYMTADNHQGYAAVRSMWG